MKTNHEVLKRIVKLGLLMMMGLSMSACGNSTSWKEEVLLHDGSKIIVERYVDRGGRHEIGQRPPIKEQSLSFTLPSTDHKIKWEDKGSQDVGGGNFHPMLLEIANGIVYVLASPAGCLSYNKWGRPNPPYVLFKYDGKAWQRIPLQELPSEIKLPNLVISSPDDAAKNAKNGLLSAEMIKQENEGFKQPEYRSILREGLTKERINQMCDERVRTGSGWLSLSSFSREATIEGCSKVCQREKVSDQNCPCITLFKGK